MAKIVGIGANVFDTLYSIPTYPKEDTKMRSTACKTAGGGPVATGLVAAQKLGVNTAYIGVLADDSGGTFLKKDFEKYVGQELGVSEYVQLDQERINLFADATLDHQWIHVDTEKAAVESPFKSTIAHGYLTLSMLPYMWNQIIEVNNLKMMINYGMDKMKFGQAVLSGQSIRLRTTLQSLQNLRGTAKAEIKFKIEIEDQKKSAVEGIAIFLYYFE